MAQSCTNPEDRALETFGQAVGETPLGLLSAEGAKQQVVGGSELIPCHAAQLVWSERIWGRRIILCIDNEAARFGLIKGTSPTRDSAWLINCFWSAETKNGSNTWIERVPSASNCADGPSRGRYEILGGTGLQVRHIKLPRDYERDLAAQWGRHGAEDPKAPSSTH